MADIRSLADHLGISIGTVSRALNNRPGVNPDTRERVLRGAAEIGYVANASGRSLRSGATNTIGFVIETGAPAILSGDNFFDLLIDGLNGVLTESGYDLVILPCRSADDPVGFLSRVVARGIVDALIITATRRRDHRIELLSNSPMPFLTLGRSESSPGFPWFDLDFEGMADRSIRELAAVGHRRIAAVVPESDAMLGYHYLDGYRRAMAARGLPVSDDLVIRTPSSEEGGRALAAHLLAQADRPTAVAICSEVVTLGLYAGLSEAGLQPGADLSVVTTREFSHFRYLHPAPACFRVPLTELGCEMGSVILDMLRARKTGAPDRKIIWPAEFVPGETIRPAPGRAV